MFAVLSLAAATRHERLCSVFCTKPPSVYFTHPLRAPFARPLETQGLAQQLAPVFLAVACLLHLVEEALGLTALFSATLQVSSNSTSILLQCSLLTDIHLPERSLEETDLMAIAESQSCNSTQVPILLGWEGEGVWVLDLEEGDEWVNAFPPTQRSSF